MPSYEQVLKHHVTQEDPAHNYDVEVYTLSYRNASVAKVTFYTVEGKEDLYATGSSKRVAGDPVRDDIGEQLAVGRALIAMGQYLVGNAEGELPE
jgi:Domain of unknown function (DUF1876)